jgi:uncharacterized protein YbbC (DUF1343 family)
MLEGLDLLVFNIQTVGVRFYTYITTLLYTMQAAAESGIAYIVCDRPNPIGGQIIEGPVLESGYESFVGPGPLPIRHGLTIGELAKLYNEAWGVGCDLTVVPCSGWRREVWFDDTGLPWVPPSPAMPWLETAIVYPGTCLVEGTNLSEGRGTALPFHLVGAPWVDGARLADALNEQELPGVRFRPTVFQPSADKWAGQRCGGVQLHVTDRRTFRPVTAGLHVLAAARGLYPDALSFRGSGEDSRRPHLDLLAGGSSVRSGLEAGLGVAEITSTWGMGLDAFAERRKACLLYH